MARRHYIKSYRGCATTVHRYNELLRFYSRCGWCLYDFNPYSSAKRTPIHWDRVILGGRTDIDEIWNLIPSCWECFKNRRAYINAVASGDDILAFVRRYINPRHMGHHVMSAWISTFSGMSKFDVKHFKNRRVKQAKYCLEREVAQVMES